MILRLFYKQLCSNFLMSKKLIHSRVEKKIESVKSYQINRTYKN